MTKSFLFQLDADEKEMLHRIAKDTDRSMSWVLRRLVRRANTKLYEVKSDGDPFEEVGLR